MHRLVHNQHQLEARSEWPTRTVVRAKNDPRHFLNTWKHLRLFSFRFWSNCLASRHRQHCETVCSLIRWLHRECTCSASLWKLCKLSTSIPYHQSLVVQTKEGRSERAELSLLLFFLKKKKCPEDLLSTGTIVPGHTLAVSGRTSNQVSYHKE